MIAQLTRALACGAAGQFIARTLSYEARALPRCRSSFRSFELGSIMRCVKTCCARPGMTCGWAKCKCAQLEVIGDDSQRTYHVG